MYFFAWKKSLLLPRFELGTSSVWFKCSNHSAISAKLKQLLFWQKTNNKSSSWLDSMKHLEKRKKKTVFSAHFSRNRKTWRYRCDVRSKISVCFTPVFSFLFSTKFRTTFDSIKCHFWHTQTHAHIYTYTAHKISWRLTRKFLTLVLSLFNYWKYMCHCIKKMRGGKSEKRNKNDVLIT